MDPVHPCYRIPYIGMLWTSAKGVWEGYDVSTVASGLGNPWRNNLSPKPQGTTKDETHASNG